MSAVRPRASEYRVQPRSTGEGRYPGRVFPKDGWEWLDHETGAWEQTAKPTALSVVARRVRPTEGAPRP